MKGKILFKKITAVLLAGAMTLGIAACGSKGNRDGSGTGSNETGTDSGSVANSGGNGSSTPGTGKKENDDGYVYVPRYYDLPTEAEASYTGYGSAAFYGNRLYYVYSYIADGKQSESWCYIDTDNPEAGAVVLMDLSAYEIWTADSATNVISMAAGDDGEMILLLQSSPLISSEASEEEYARQHKETTYQLKKLAADGTELFDTDITPYLQMDLANAYVQKMFTDKAGAIYISNGTSYIWVFDTQGNHTADIDLSRLPGFMMAVNVLPDGRLGVVQTGSTLKLSAYNPDSGQFSDTYSKLPPECFNSSLTEGPNGGVLLHSSSALYEYDMETQEYTELVKWRDCDINPDNVQQTATLVDGRIGVFCSEWNTGTSSLIVLERVLAAENSEQKVLTLGCMVPSAGLQAAVVEFNKNNGQYRIEIKSYGESVDYSAENAYEDARTLFYNDILTGNAPDMFMADDIDMKLFAVKGLIEDLSPYLDSSTAAGREDLFESILNAYTVGGTLCAIPMSFYIQTLAGRVSEVGTESGWTLDEMIAFAEAHPETPILPYATKIRVLSACMLFDFDSWVNWETGECHFDTPEFKKVLEFANKYPAQEDESLPSTQQQIMAHMALLDNFGLSDLQSWQLETVVFGEPITAIGYPSSNSNGVLAFGNEAVCISTTSQNKEAAWSFIETLLTKEAQENERLMGFPVRIDAFEKDLAKAMEPDYMFDENGEILLDENGKPKEISHYTFGWSDGFEVSLYAVTEEEADGIRHVISQIDGIYEYDRSMMEIILEEIEPYFAGQKSVDEVTGIIQSRVQLYINENR